jgi:Phage integrase, N-terminal SAM-like domain
MNAAPSSGVGSISGTATRFECLLVLEPEEPYTSPARPRLLDQVRAAIRTRHYSLRTEEAYIGWIRRFILFHGKRHPAEMGKAEIERFLTSLAVQRRVAASTQNQALAALLFSTRTCSVAIPVGSMKWCERSGRGACRSCSRTPRSRPCSRSWDGCQAACSRSL